MTVYLGKDAVNMMAFLRTKRLAPHFENAAADGFCAPGQGMLGFLHPRIDRELRYFCLDERP
jgi:hypothetical protein